MSVALLVMTDGRQHCLREALPSALANLTGPITHIVIHDDSGDVNYRLWLEANYPQCTIIGGRQRRGFAGAIDAAWDHLKHRPEQWVFHLEDDFTFNRPVPLLELAHTLLANRHLVQLALRRQPWNREEIDAGGIVEQHPDDYVERFSGGVAYGRHWLEHRRFFTTNPSLYRRELCERGWPQVDHSEGIFTHQLLADPTLRFGFWGARDSGEWVTHIGDVRVGTGY